MSDIVTNIGELASFIGSLTVVGGALIWIYNKFIGEPRERKREQEAKKRQEEMILLITEKNEPLNQSIQGLLDFSADSEADRELLHRISDENTLRIGEHDEELQSHTKQLNEHNGRLIALETRNGITTVQYREKHGEDD
jgi:hypothetical protein